jgi:hypothetical protein
MNTRIAALLILFAGFGCQGGSGEKFLAPTSKSVELASRDGVFWTVPREYTSE